MWSYECVFEHRDYNKKKTRNSAPLTQTSKCIVTDSGEKALKFAIDELKNFTDYELIGIVRRNAIVHIIK